MIKIIKVFVETDTPAIHLLNDTTHNVGEGTINGEKVYMMEKKVELEKIPKMKPNQGIFNKDV